MTDRWTELERLCDAASPGAWVAEGLPYDGHTDPCIRTSEGLYVAQTAYDGLSQTTVHDVDADAAFIAAANPAAIKELIAAARAGAGEGET